MSLPPALADAYCWTRGLFTMLELHDTVNAHGVPYSGVGPDRWNHEDRTPIGHDYYKWVSVCLMFCAVLFYIPKYIWDYLEGKALDLVIYPIIINTHLDILFYNSWLCTKDVCPGYSCANNYPIV